MITLTDLAVINPDVASSLVNLSDKLSESGQNDLAHEIVTTTLEAYEEWADRK